MTYRIALPNDAVEHCHDDAKRHLHGIYMACPGLGGRQACSGRPAPFLDGCAPRRDPGVAAERTRRSTRGWRTGRECGCSCSPAQECELHENWWSQP